MAARNQNRLRSFKATACLVAVALLFAPLVGAAWSSYSGSCCTTGQCPIKSHHHQHSSPASETPMDCGHEMPGMAACSMSCCHNLNSSAISPGLFVLPAPINVSAPSILKSPIDLREPMNFLRSVEPLSPPPRLFPAAG